MTSAVAQLKAAKTAFDAKDYKSAVKACKAALQAPDIKGKDSLQYNGWVLLGAASFQDGALDQAEKSYAKAIELNKAGAPAWKVREMAAISLKNVVNQGMHELLSASKDPAKLFPVLVELVSLTAYAAR